MVFQEAAIRKLRKERSHITVVLKLSGNRRVRISNPVVTDASFADPDNSKTVFLFEQVKAITTVDDEVLRLKEKLRSKG